MSDTNVKITAQDPRRDDALADRTTFWWILGFLVARYLVDILSTATELSRQHSDFPFDRIVVYESTGYALFLCFFPVITRLTSIASPGREDWRFVIPFHLAASVVISAAHVFAFVMVRKLIFIVLYGEPYIFTDNVLRDFIYEYRKDLFGYGLLVFLIAFGRQLQQQRRELAAAQEDARKSHRLTLKCGGRQIFVEAGDVLWVKSASNYVEVKAGGAVHLARATLATVERQLQDAGAKVVRVHRSWIVNAGAIAKIEPTGEGDIKIEMKDGTMVPGSRRYRDRLPNMTDA